jgi:hypothetical protein
VKHRLSTSFVSLLFVVPLLACRVDNAGLSTEMPVFPRDSGAVPDVATGAAGDTGTAGIGMTSGTAGEAAVAGSGGSTGAAGDQSSGTAGAGAGAGTTGAAGDMGTAGMGAAGDQGSAGTTGAAGVQGGAGTIGAAGVQGTAGSGAAGTMGTAGAGGAGGAGGMGGMGGMGVAGAPGCGPKTCAAGCCDNTGKCVAGRANDRCGNGGAACSPCGKCLLCNASGVCDVDPSSTWDVVCVQATIAPLQPNMTTWDPHTAGPDGPNPDPFCQFEMPTNTTNPALGKSSLTIPDTFTPVWNADVTPSGKPIKASDLMSSTKSWRLWIGDDDGCTARGCVGQELCEIDQPLTAGALISGQIVEQNLGSCLSMTVKFVCESN